MSDPALALQKAVAAALKTASVCDGRVYDRVPEPGKRFYPYCTLADDTLSNDGNSCWDQTEAFCTVHVWEQNRPGHVNVKEQVGRIRAALDTEIVLDAPFKVISGSWQSTRFPPTGDALSTHAVMTFRYIIQH